MTSHFTNVPKFSDTWWDTAYPEERNKVILEGQLKPLLSFAKQNIPFYREHYRHITEGEIANLSDLDDFVAKIPHVSKVHIASVPSQAFIPEGIIHEIHPDIGKFYKYGTGGTTSKPAKIFHSISDWRAFAITANRLIEHDIYLDGNVKIDGSDEILRIASGFSQKETDLNGKKILAAYNGDHITNHIYRTMLTAFGVELITRLSPSASLDDIFQCSQEYQVNGILAPPGGGNQAKGAFLSDLMIMDAKNSSQDAWHLSHKYNPDFKFVFWSSMPIDKDLLSYLKEEAEIPYIKGHFGSTELCPTGSSCSQHMRDFHLNYAHALLLIADMHGYGLAKPDHFGYTLVTKMNGVDRNGDICMPSGMVFINYLTGDGGKLTENGVVCGCGRNTPVLYDIDRVEFKEGKAIHGCQNE